MGSGPHQNKPCIDCGQVTASTRCPSCLKTKQGRVRPHHSGDYAARAKVVRDTAQVCWICGEQEKPGTPGRPTTSYRGRPTPPGPGPPQLQHCAIEPIKIETELTTQGTGYRCTSTPTADTQPPTPRHPRGRPPQSTPNHHPQGGQAGTAGHATTYYHLCT